MRLAKEAGHDLDVEDPSRAEWRLKQSHDLGCYPEHLRAALRVVKGHAQHQRCRCGEDAAEIVPQRLPLDLSSQQANTGPEHHLNIRIVVEMIDELGNGVQRRRKVRVPEAGVASSERRGLE